MKVTVTKEVDIRKLQKWEQKELMLKHLTPRQLQQAKHELFPWDYLLSRLELSFAMQEELSKGWQLSASSPIVQALPIGMSVSGLEKNIGIYSKR